MGLRFHPATILATILVPWCSSVFGYLDHTLPRDGLVTSPIGYPGVTYQSIRYEPLCGTLGTDARFSNPFAIGHCDSVIDVYSNNSIDRLAFYDESGVRLVGAVVGGGRDLCMCFALGNPDGSAGDICWWFNGDAQVDIWWTLQLDHLIGGAFRPGSAKSLPQCSEVDLDGLRASWSATAVMPSATESVITLGDRTQTTTFTPSGKSNPSTRARSFFTKPNMPFHPHSCRIYHRNSDHHNWA